MFYTFPNTTPQMPPTKTNWISTAFVVETFYFSNPRTFCLTDFAQKPLKIQFFHFPIHLSRFEVFLM